ncbi:MAG TPA: DUF4255 domain-containing protein [Ktedonobacteraceae bacterium]|nr:DUF4255 domain-containing protein [Ktedonobacteraceae bacterium]
MSNYLAIATVTAALREILHEAALAVVPGVSVTIKRPDNAGGEGQEKAAINIYLYQVNINPFWRNADLPAYDSSGKRVHRPQIALDLDYLFSFHGSELSMEPQRLLGSALIYLQADPWIKPDTIQRVISQDSYLAHSDLFTQVDMIKTSQLSLSLEELSKLWSIFFQVPYTLSVAFRASTVLLEAGENIPPVPPVKEPRVHLNREFPPR